MVFEFGIFNYYLALEKNHKMTKDEIIKFWTESSDKDYESMRTLQDRFFKISFLRRILFE